jgi:hypothetical protein
MGDVSKELRKIVSGLFEEKDTPLVNATVHILQQRYQAEFSKLGATEKKQFIEEVRKSVEEELQRRTDTLRA